MPTPTHPALALAFLAAYSVFTIWTVRRLLPLLEQNRESLSRRGIAGFGLPFWVAMTALTTLEYHGPWNLWLRLGLNAFIMLPISLWAGYGWGRGMTTFFGDR